MVVQALLRELGSLGIKEYCVAAGARNAPLLAVLLACAETDGLTLRHFFEERSAAFFALGRVMETQQPVAVVTTSGTAVAELFPAVMEAHYQAAPLIVITADRPSRYRGSGAPQAVEQQDFFSRYVTRSVEIEGLADGSVSVADSGLGRSAGPVHFNVCLEEGLISPEGIAAEGGSEPRPPAAIAPEHRAAWSEFWAREGRLLVVAAGIHPADVPDACRFLAALGAPVVAESTSNLRGEASVAALLLRPDEATLAAFPAEKVLRLGGVPSWRWWRDLEDRAEVPVLSVSRAPFPGLARQAHVAVVPWELLLGRVPPSPAGLPQPSIDRLSPLLERYPRAEPSWMRHLSQLIGGGATVFLGNSLPIREWNLAAADPAPGTRFFANRGANGIDGLISTWLGVSTNCEESWLVLGDLSTLYDLSAPWILAQLPPARRHLVVINNGGGKIFSQVAWLQTAPPAAREMMENSHALSFEPWARMWGLPYRRLHDPAALDEAVLREAACTVWEIKPDSLETAAFWQDWRKTSA
jgi:2-succinyl-5-enolpyruvyl-6-hydroxy-3-cyclohexene-1-carboxylate synthase